MPWDTVVFLTITTVGFGFSLQQLRHPHMSHALQLPFTQMDESSEVGVGSDSRGIFDLGCLDRLNGRDRLTNPESTIRLRGKLCRLNTKAMHNFDGVTVKNLTNGFESTIFFRGFDSTFVTDYLVLVPGRNLIQLEWKDTPSAEARTYIAEVLQK